MLIACLQEKMIGTQCRENAEVLVPGATLHTLLRGSFGIASVQLRREFSLLICCRSSQRNQSTRV
jgi:hypothetical protein